MNDWQVELLQIEAQDRRRAILRDRAQREGVLQAILDTAAEMSRQDPSPHVEISGEMYPLRVFDIPEPPSAPLTPRQKVEADLRKRGVLR